MVDKLVSTQTQQRARGGASGLGLKLGLVAGLAACLLCASYLARTPLVLGPTVSAYLGKLAADHRVDLQVKAMRPLGLTGIRLEQVQLTTRRGSYLVEADLDTVDITPSLSQLVLERRVHPETVAVDGGQVMITRQRAAPQPEAAPEGSDADEAPESKPAASKPAPRPQPAELSTRTILRNVSVAIHPAPLRATTRPLTLHRAEMHLTRGARARAIDFRYGYGELPDGTSFAMRRVRGPGPKVFVVEPRTPTRVDRWFVDRPPVGLSVEQVRICPQCEPARVDMQGLEVMLSPTRAARTEEVTLLASHREVRTGAKEVAFESLGEPLGYAMQNLEALYDSAARTAIIQGDVLDANLGHLSFAANWSGQWGVLETHMQLERFDTRALWKDLAFEQRIRGGRWSGEVETSYEPAMDLAEVQVELDVADLWLDLPLVTDEALDFERLGLELDALVQPRARTVSVSSGQARLGDAGPVRFGGYFAGARRGWVFDVHASAEGLAPQKLRDGLPPAIARVARGTDFGGDFSFAIASAGHTAYPEGIDLSVDFGGDVEVRGDSSYADVLALAANGPPTIELPGTLSRRVDPSRWIDYDQLPPHVPRVLTAAEDAQFFNHDGFDWRGLRRALVHNVRAGRIKRGGSTLSQQLSKNLFLDHERTLVRKLQEAYVTWRLEEELSKQRILELYMNLVQWGPNVQGINRAAERYFGVVPADLTVEQTALLASVLPGPSLFGQQVLAGRLPSSRLEKIEHILSNLRFLGEISARDYRKMYDAASRGDIGGLQLTLCDDDGKAPEDAPPCS